MRWRRQAWVLVLCSSLAGPRRPAAAADASEPTSLAARIDLTRITIVQAEYARAAAEKNADDLATYDREIATMLRDDVLPYAPAAPSPAPGAMGRGSAGDGIQPAAHEPAVATDEEEVGAAWLEAKVADLAREFVALEEKRDRASIQRKAYLLGAMQAISEEAQFPATAKPTAEQSRAQKERAVEERYEQGREQAERDPRGQK